MDFITKYLQSMHTSFPVLAIIGFSVVVLLLVIYYFLVIKCCLSWNRTNHHRGLISSSRSHHDRDPSFDCAPEPRGLDEALIESFPVFEFKKRSTQDQEDSEERSLTECPVCLNEFEESEKLKIVPNCCHIFHMECIDVWLRDNNNCPICRTKVSVAETGSYGNVNVENSVQSHSDDFLIIEMGHNQRGQRLLGAQETSNLVEIRPQAVETMVLNQSLNEIASSGDECSDFGGKGDRFGVIQPVRRSVSMDSSDDRRVYLTTLDQENMHKTRMQVENEHSSSNEGTSSCRARSTLLSFGSGKFSRSSVLPV